MKRQTVCYCLFLSMSSAHGATTKQRIPDVISKHPAMKTSFSGGIKHIISQKKITESGANSLSDALRSSGQLQLHDASGTGSQTTLGLRGFGANASSNTLVLINGIPLTNPDLMPPDLNTIPLENISEIEITAGSESVLYGDQAVGGVINLITDHSKDKSLRLQCGTGSFNARDCHARFVNNYRQINYQLSLLANSTDNYRTHNHYFNETISGSALYERKTDKILVDYKLTRENMQYPGALTTSQVYQDRRQSSNDTDFFKDGNQYIHIQHKHTISSDWSFSTDTFLNNMDGKGVLSTPFSQSRQGIYLKPTLINKTDTYQVKSGLDVKLDKYHLGSAYGLTDNLQKQGGLFVLANIPVSKKLNVAMGTRGAAQSTQLTTQVNAYTLNHALATTLSVNYQLSTTIIFYLRRAGNFRFPKAEENTAGFQPLRAQRGISYEAGISYEKADKLLLVEMYQLNLRDEIAFDPLQTPQNPFGSNQNLSPTTRAGLSLSLKSNITKNLSAETQLNYVNARFQAGIDAGNRIPLVADFIAHGSIQYKWHSDWQIYVEGVFTGNEFAANDNENVTGRQGGYMIYNFNLRYQHHALSAALRMNNIFNKYYYLYTVYQTGIYAQSYYPAPDRNAMLSVTYTFS